MIKDNITVDQKNLIIDLSAKGYKNQQIAAETMLKYSTVCYWKKKMRNEGIAVLSLLGRPSKKTTAFKTIAEQNEINLQDKLDNHQQPIV